MRLSLYYPVNPHHVNQHFAENVPCVADFGKSTQTVLDPLKDGTCPVGSDKLYPHFGMRGHNGVDLMAGEQEVRASCAGVVVEIQDAPARGLGIGVLTDEKFGVDGYGEHFVKIRYWHLKTILVSPGQRVVEGDLLGISDSTGFSSGNHLHFEGQLIQKDDGGHPTVLYLPGNIAGAIDLEPHFNGQYAADIAKKADLLRQTIKVLQMMIAVLQKRINK